MHGSDVLTLLLVAAVVAPVRAQTNSCPSNCIVTGDSGKTYDLSRLKGKTFTTTADGGTKYSFTMCGVNPTACPDDPDNVVTGMAVQTFGTSECYVLGVYGEYCTWQETEPGSASILVNPREWQPRGMQWR